MANSPQTMSIDARMGVASWAADCAEHVLAIYESAVPADTESAVPADTESAVPADTESAVPADTRVRDAIEQARAFARGELAIDDAVRRRGGDAGAAARDAPTPAAKAAAYAAEQAAACAHMGAHALGAAGYAAKAATLAAGDGEEFARSEALRQVAGMSDAVAAALACLPALGENRAGPLGPGRLASGHVGQAIRAIQAELRVGGRVGPARRVARGLGGGGR